MPRVVGQWLLSFLVCALAGCGKEAPLAYKPQDDQARLLKSLKSQLEATVVELESKVAEKRKAYGIWKEAEGRSTSEERQRDTAAREAYWEAFYGGRELRLEIIDLQLKIQRIEGFWEPDPDVNALSDPKRRDEALRRLLMRNADYESTEEASCRVNHVISCPQPEGPPMVAVFKAEDWDETGGPGRAIGHIILFLASGSHVPYWQGSNGIEPTGIVRDLNANGVIDVVDVNPCDGGDGEDYYELYVLPITPAQKDTLLVWWRESYDAEYEEIVWGFEAVDPDGDGVHDIMIGLRKEDGRIEEQARYRWSASAQRWTGPPGNTMGAFYRFDPEVDEDLQVEAFANKRALKPHGR